MKTIFLCGVVFVCLLAGNIAQQVVVEKVVLPKNTVVPIASSHVSINSNVYRDFYVSLFLGDEGTDKTPIQKTPFAIDFNGKIWSAMESDTTVPSGVKATEVMGFTKTSSTSYTLTSRGATYTTFEYSAHMRLDSKHKMSANVPRGQFTVITDSARWVKNRMLQAGLLPLGYDSPFLKALTDAYKSDKGETDPIPVSWSLNPVDESKLFDSRATYLGETFILNGFRATGKQYGNTGGVKNGVYYYSSMDFKVGDKWSTFGKEVCIDPSADTFIGLPNTEFRAVWDIIQADICAGNTTSTCDYSKATIDKMTPFEISLATSKVALSQVAPPKFESHVKLQGSDVIKKDADGKFLRLGLVENANLNTVCNSNSIVLGRWFFTKVELTMWVKSSTSVTFSFSNIEKENKSQKDTAAAGLGLLIIIGIILVVVVIAAAGVAVYKKVSGGSGSGNYDSVGLDGGNDTSMTGKP